MATVLLVEDNDDVREMMAVALKLDGHAVRVARNGREALADLQKAPRPCVIVLDLMMPVMNGWELRDELRANPALSKIPVVVVSAVTRELADGLSADAYVPKPVDIDRLLDVVCEYCDGGRRHRRRSVADVLDVADDEEELTGLDEAELFPGQ